MSADGRPVPPELAQPEGLFGRILKEFGLQWTNIAVLSGVLFSTFGLEKYLNAGVWTMSAVASFCVAYFFRRQVGADFPRVATVCGLLCAMALAGPVGVCLFMGVDITGVISTGRNLSTAYLAFSIVVPLAFMLGAYRRQEEDLGEGLPAAILKAIHEEITNAPFYRENQVYVVRVMKVTTDMVTLRTTLTYTVRNRKKQAVRWQGSFISPAGSTRYLKAMVGGKEIDVSDPDYLSPRAMRVSRSVAAGGGLAIEFEAEEDFRPRDAELFTTYAPADSLSLSIVNPYGAALKFYVETLYPEKVDPECNGDVTSCQISSGLLPYQGFRLHWSPTH